MKPYFVVEAYTNVGRVRRNNEDNYYVNGKFLENAALDDYFIIDIPMQKGVFGVFDGMGGQSNGEFASYTASTTLSAYQHDLLKNPDGFINDYVRDANDRICAEIQRTQKRIGTTMGVAVINDDKLKVYNIGDTRVYYFRDGKIYQLSKDHTTVNQLVEAGIMTREQAAGDKRKNELSQHLGIMPNEMVIQPFVSQEVEWGENDVLLICSDGVTDALSDQELEDIVNQCSQKGFFAEHIVKTAIRKGSKDNATAVIVQACDKGGIKNSKNAPSKIKYGLIVAIMAACLLIGTAAGILFNKLFADESAVDNTTTLNQQTSSVETTEPTTEPVTEPTTEPSTNPNAEQTTDTTTDISSTDSSVSETQSNPGSEGVYIPANNFTVPKTGNIVPSQEDGPVKLRSNYHNFNNENVIGSVSQQTQVKVLGEDYKEGVFEYNHWYYVEINGSNYWVAADYVVLDENTLG